MQDLSQVADEFGRPLRIAESAHFVVVCELPKIKVERSTRTPHELMHLYVERLERLYDDYTQLFGLADDQITDKPLVLLWSSPEDHAKAGKVFCGYEDPGPVYQRGVVCTYSARVGKAPLKDDDALHTSLVHHLSHGLMNLQRPAAWTAKQKAGWADAGIAHWFENASFGTTEVFCYAGVESTGNFKSGRWRRGVRKLVAADKAPALAELVELDTEELSLEQHALSFSLVDYLIARDPRQLNDLLVHLRSQSPTRDGMKAVYGESLASLEESWKAWILEQYPAR